MYILRDIKDNSYIFEVTDNDRIVILNAYEDNYIRYENVMLARYSDNIYIRFNTLGGYNYINHYDYGKKFIISISDGLPVGIRDYDPYSYVNNALRGLQADTLNTAFKMLKYDEKRVLKTLDISIQHTNYSPPQSPLYVDPIYECIDNINYDIESEFENSSAYAASESENNNNDLYDYIEYSSNNEC